MGRPFWIVIAMLLLLLPAACSGAKNAEPATAENVAAAGDAAPDLEAGKKRFMQTCAACHGAEGEGVTGLGKDMAHSEFIAESSDQELLEFLKIGRMPNDPLNTTGVLMPPKGGNPRLTDEQLLDVIAYVRSLHQ